MKTAFAIAGLLLMLGCSSPSSTSTAVGPGDEATSQTSPTQEDTAPTDGGGDGADAAGKDGGDGTDVGGDDDQGVSVDLPGLPIGGNEAVFSPDAPTQCVDVNVTGFTLPDSVGIEFTKFEVPDQFTVGSSPCSDSPCVGIGYRVTADSGGCTVSVTWKGDPVDEEPPSALRSDARAFCTSQTACAGVTAAIDAAKKTQTGGQFTIRLVVNAPAGGESTPVDGESTPTEGESTPVDGESTGSSPSDNTSDG